jgi:hypothetical protein
VNHPRNQQEVNVKRGSNGREREEEEEPTDERLKREKTYKSTWTITLWYRTENEERGMRNRNTSN